MKYNTLKYDLCNKWLANYEPLYNLHSALRQIASKAFKLIPERKIHSCEDINNALLLLEKWKLLSPERLEILIELSELLQGPTECIKNDLKKVNPRYESESFCQCLDFQLPNSYKRVDGEPSYQEHSTKYEPVYTYLSENMGTNQRWIDLGRLLPGMRNITEELRNDLTLRQKDKILKLLEEFESLSEEYSLNTLLHYLEKSQLRRQSDIIRESFPHLL